MVNKRPPQTDDEILEAFAELLDQIRPETTEEIEAILLEAGLDPAELVTEARQVVQESLANSPYNWRNEQEALNKARGELEDATQSVPSTKAGMLDAINQLFLQPRTQLVSAHFRNQNFEEMTYEELKSLYMELKFLASRD